MIPATKADVEALSQRMLRAIKDSAKDTKLHFDVVAENLTNDYRGIFNDRTVDLTNARKDHERRIERLEARVGIFS